MSEISIRSSRPHHRTMSEAPVTAEVEITFAPGYAKEALAQLARAVMDVLVEARKIDGSGTHGTAP